MAHRTTATHEHQLVSLYFGSCAAEHGSGRLEETLLAFAIGYDGRSHGPSQSSLERGGGTLKAGGLVGMTRRIRCLLLPTRVLRRLGGRMTTERLKNARMCWFIQANPSRRT